MSTNFYLFFYLIIFLALFNLENSQINVLGPPSIVQKVKELEDGSKKIKYFFIINKNTRN